SDPGTADTQQIAWDFGDGTVIALHSATDPAALAPTHTFTLNGTYTVTLTVVDDDGGIGTFSYQISIATLGLQADPCHPQGTALVVGGTTSADLIRVLPADSGGLNVTLGGSSLGVFTGLSRVIVYGQAGDDDIQAAGSIGVDMWFFGGDGSDKLKGGAGNDVLLGGLGNDQIHGLSGRDLLVGGSGADELVGNSDDDILIAGNINFADQIAALCAIMDEWTSGRSFSQRVDNLVHGTSSDRANGSVLLQNGTTVVDDSDADRLTGASGSDWFFYSAAEDTATDLHSDEVFDDLEWL
ncbi:MAG: PKD domain-containing protein, partial [Planctomycetales bacterium]|nr:PKD domain-containing protein [Planctomycetales bacterium]